MRNALAIAGVAALTLGLLVLVALTARVLLVVFGGILLGVLLRALAGPLARATGASAPVAVCAVVALLAALIAGFATFFAHEVWEQFREIGARLTEYWQRFEEWLRQFPWGEPLLRSIAGEASNKAGTLARLLATVLGALSTLVVAVFIGIYLALGPATYRRGLLSLLPARLRRRTAATLRALDDSLRHWLLGTLVCMTVVGSCVGIALWLIGVPFAAALGLLAFALEFIPYLGPIVAAIPGVLVAATVSPQLGLYALAVYFGVQVAENWLLAPYVYQRMVQLPPALLIAAQVVIGTLLGVLGVVFATPLTACALVLTQRLVRPVTSARPAAPSSAPRPR